MSNDSIHFCKECHNITSIHTDEDDKLIYSCKTCGTTENFKETDNCIYTLNFEDFDSSLYINESGSPALIKDPADFDSIYIVMPMKG